MGKAAKKERRALKEIEKLSFEIFDKAMSTLSEEERAKFLMKTGAVTFVDGSDKPVINPTLYYTTVMSFVDKLEKMEQ